MNILFNGQSTTIKPVANLQELLNDRADLPASFAVAINDQFVPKSTYGQTPVNEGDRVELVIPMQGG